MNKTSLISIFIIFITLISCTNPSHVTTDITANNVLERAIGKDASRFVLSLEKDSDSIEWFKIVVKNDRVFIKGNSSVALCKGAYHYIKENNLGVVTWEGTNITMPSELADKEYERRSCAMPYRMYLNPCTYGYTTAWWTWERWEKELDWMALHGINMPVALLGQEIIWQEVWEAVGIDKSKLSDYYCGPAFLPWFRMGNLYNHHGTLPQNWMEKDKVLQQKILNRMKALGMRPILPAFSGHVPPHFRKIYPDAKVYELKNWGGVPDENASLLLDPKDPLFTKVSKLFLEKYELTYGNSSDLFLADAFNEMLPPVSEENKNIELAEYGEAIYKGLKEYNPNATWVLQGWTFGHQRYFWTSDATKSFLSRIPKDNLMMLDYGEDRHEIWDKLDAFYGCKWTYGYVHNYGGQQSLFGDFNLYYEKYRDLINNPLKGNLVGYGCLPEAIENNSIVYEYIFDIPWGATDKPVNNWIHNHLSNRYGKLTPQIEEAWKIAMNNTYTVKEWRIKGNNLGYGTYMHNNRPTSHINPSDYTGNPDSIKSVLKLFIEAYENGNKSELLFYDIIDFAQHYAAYKADFHLIKTIEHYKASDFSNGDIQFNNTKKHLEWLEVLQVETDGSFTKWCEDAISHATTEEEKALYLKNAKAQITLWGGNRLKDYASKSWSGIISDFYVPRWQMLLDDMKKNKSNFDLVSSQNEIIAWEEAWILKESIPESPKKLQKDQYIELVKGIIIEE